MALDRCNGCFGGKTVDRRMLPIKATYFFLFAAVAFLHPYVIVFMKHLGLTPTETSIILTAVTISSALARIVIGTIADAFSKHSVAMTICCVIAAAFHVMLYFTPAAHAEPVHNATASVFCHDGQYYVCVLGSFPVDRNLSQWSEMDLFVNRTAEVKSEEEDVATKGGVCDLSCCSELLQSRINDFMNLSLMGEVDTSENFISVRSLLNQSDSNFISKDYTSFPVRPSSRQSVDQLEVSASQKMCRNLNNLTLRNVHISVAKTSEIECTLVYQTEIDHMMPPTLDQCGSGASSVYDDCNLSCKGQMEEPRSQFGKTFWMFFFIFFVIIFFINPTFSVIDSITYIALRDRGGEFGKARLWGTFALGVCAPISGFVMDAIGKSGTVDIYLFPLMMCAGLCLITAVTVYRFVPDEAVHPRGAKEPLAPSVDKPERSKIRKNYKRLFSNPVIDIVFFSVLVSGIMLGFHESFFFWFLKNLDATQLVLGMCVLAMCVSEIILLFVSGRIVSLLGYRVCLYVTFIVYGSRLLVNSFIVNPWLAVGTEAAQSVCTGLLFPAASLSINALAPDGMHGTIQGILGALQYSVGKAIGFAVAGVLFQAVGPRQMYRIMSGVVFAYTILLVVVLEALRFAKCSRGQKTEDPEKKTSLELVVNTKSEEDEKEDEEEEEEEEEEGEKEEEKEASQ